MARYIMTAKRKAALRKAQLASARKRRRNRRIDKKISRVQRRTNKRTAKHSKKFYQSGVYTHSQEGGVYVTKKGAKAYNKSVKSYNKGSRKISRLKAKKR